VIVETFYRAPAALAGRLVGANDFVTIIDTIIFRGDDVATALLAKAGVFHGNFSFLLCSLRRVFHGPPGRDLHDVSC